MKHVPDKKNLFLKKEGICWSNFMVSANDNTGVKIETICKYTSFCRNNIGKFRWKAIEQGCNYRNRIDMIWALNHAMVVRDLRQHVCI